MRILCLVSVIFVYVIIFFTLNAESETCQYENMTVEKDETVVFDNQQIWLCGDILIDGHLVIENSHLNVNRTLDYTTSEIRINPGGYLEIINTTIDTKKYYLYEGSNETTISPYTLVSDAGNLSVYNSQIYYGMIWLVGGNAEITGLALDGFSMINYGIFSEDTNLKATGVSIRNYTLGLRSIGKEPNLGSVYYYNCGTHMTQEWWITFSAFESSTNLSIAGFEVRQWDGEKIVGSWNWAKQYEIDSSGMKIEHQANFSFYLNLGFGYVERYWEGSIDNNTHINQYFDLNHRNVKFDSGTIFVDGSKYVLGEKAPKFSEVNFSVSISNPTDINFNNLYLDLLIDSQSGYSRSSISLPSKTNTTANVTWSANKEGPFPFAVQSVIIDYSDNSTDEYVITLTRFLEVGPDDNFIKSEGSWTALLAITIILSLCSYIIYAGMEEEISAEAYSEDSESSNEEIDGDSDLREIALTQENDEEKET